ncbi:MAG: hypothetical protein O2854_07305 [Chloroflexi bacterium]|nr:hypothetical protein [Chloroflexota bacterium]
MTPEEKSKALTVRIPNDLWKSVKIKCVQEDTNIQTVLAEFLAKWTNGRNGLNGVASGESS